MDTIAAITGAPQAPSIQAAPTEDAQNSKLKEACSQVEGLFLKMLLKEGMSSMVENAEGHSGSALSYCLEQTADEVARSGDLGVAENIYAQLSANM